LGTVVGAVSTARGSGATRFVFETATLRLLAVYVGAMTTATAAPCTPWGDDALVPLLTVARTANRARGDLHNAAKRGQLHPIRQSNKPGRPALLPRDEALAVLTAAALAVAAGIVFSSALRAVQAGATFPLPTEGTAA